MIHIYLVCYKTLTHGITPPPLLYQFRVTISEHKFENSASGETIWWFFQLFEIENVEICVSFSNPLTVAVGGCWNPPHHSAALPGPTAIQGMDTNSTLKQKN